MQKILTPITNNFVTTLIAQSAVAPLFLWRESLAQRHL
jgi:hypothetical protein